MAPIDTVATILSTIAYGETSKIARLATRELGVVSVIAKGARRPKSKFGAALQVLTDGRATIQMARHSDLHILTGFDLIRIHDALAASMDRYAAASVLSELMLRVAPSDRQVETYEFFAHSLSVLEAVPPDVVSVLGLRSIWGLVKHLGFAPTLEACARDGVAIAIADEPVPFSPAHGGVLCDGCAQSIEVSRLAPGDLRDLGAMIHGRDELPALDDRYLAAHRRLLERYVRYHLAEGATMPALTFWADQRWLPSR